MKIKRIEKPWGYEEILVQTDLYVMKRMYINQGHRMSLQYHKEKEETIYVAEVILLLWESESGPSRNFLKGETFHVMPGQIHRFGAPFHMGCILIECSTIQLDDIVRLADDYKRIK